jgi:hypothetical protein
MTASTAYAECNFDRRISDHASQISQDQLDQLHSQIDTLSDQHDVDLFFCLDAEENDENLETHVANIFAQLPTDAEGANDRLFVYLNTFIRQMSFEADGELQSVWGDAILPSLRQNMRYALAEDRFGDAFEAAFFGLENDILVPRQNENLDGARAVSGFSVNVMVHVIAHEVAHALIREFDIPVLANEEAMADSFATLWIARTKGTQAPDIIMDRVRSWFYEDSEVLRQDYDFEGEHLLDIRRAFQAACLFYGADPAENLEHVKWLGLADSDLADCSDTATDQWRGWLAVIEPHLLTEAEASKNVQVVYGEIDPAIQMDLQRSVDVILADMRRFDWPNQITLHIDTCDRGAMWSRSDRTITFCMSYLHRFYRQGQSLDQKPEFLVNHLRIEE